MDTIMESRAHLSTLPYTNCTTRIVSLLDVPIPEHATDDEHRDIYHRYTRDMSVPNARMLRDAVQSIKHGISPPVAFPTETVYGLGADATNEPATSGIFAAKGRPSDNPLIVHVSSVAHLERITGERLPEIYGSLVKEFWPGPLTILLPVPQNGVFAPNVHPAQNTIGFRIPSSKFARFFIAATDRPIAGPSANSSGKPSPTTARHVLDDLRGKINFILDGGPCDVGVESTVVDGLHDPPLILRPGGVSLSDLIAHGRGCGNNFANTAIGYKRREVRPASSGLATPASASSSEPISYVEDVTGAPRAPGMKYRHYAPNGRLILFSEEAVVEGKVESKLLELLESAPAENNSGGGSVKVGVISCHWPAFAGLSISPAENGVVAPPALSGSVFEPITSIGRYTIHTNVNVTLYNVHIGPKTTDLGHSLFGVLRLFDELGCALILAETVRRTDEGQDASEQGNRPSSKIRDIEDAVIDRIEKAAAERVE
ncbi:Sua5/YciO/YrdC/YwlC family tRNA threonylcarbamoyl adenosine modification protein [Exophiala spinifera]|uniref:Threonylcarbamoyl-AMP synthase n=1 Tax=Exophiala spinifera TaxID=91928 RepID=A0A0D1YHL7_9EURO|nr:Sua5/YciO/YrdC/YwlC family tRNA threonylcarbamoyl adenosine modification protein [Exophiala spinifera]KIW14416.1 Sua5/YciO/YrdC/YwlC family tRNA threonylcarbamoyl adenosine modification protein [Exophiala spinifera]